MPRQRLVQCFVRDDIQDGREGFFLHNFEVVARGGDAGSNITPPGESRPAQRLAPVKHPAALVPQRAQGSLHFPNGLPVDQGPHKHPGLERIANSHLLISGNQPSQKFLANLVMHQQAPGGRAALPRRPDGPKEDRPHGQVQIRAGRNDHRVIATQLEERPPQSPGHRLTDMPPHASRAGGGNQRHAMVVNKAFADGCPVPDGEAENRRVNLVSTADALGNPNRRQSGQGRLARGFPDRGIPTDRREGTVPGPHGHRKIKRGDDAHDAQGMPLLHHPMPWPFGSNRQAIQLPRQPHGEITNVNHLLHFPLPFSDDFARLDRDQPPQVLFRLAQGVAQLPNHLSSTRSGDLPPCLKRPGGAVQHFLILARRGGSHHRQPPSVNR